MNNWSMMDDSDSTWWRIKVLLCIEFHLRRYLCLCANDEIKMVHELRWRWCRLFVSESREKHSIRGCYIVSGVLSESGRLAGPACPTRKVWPLIRSADLPERQVRLKQELPGKQKSPVLWSKHDLKCFEKRCTFVLGTVCWDRSVEWMFTLYTSFEL